MGKPKIGLAGRMYSGKTTQAQRLAEVFGIPLDRFAAALKEGCQIMGAEVEGPNKDREILQLVGTEIFRKYKGPDHWINVLFSRHPDLDATGLVVDDARFVNEFQALRDRGFTLIKFEISPDEQVRRARALGVPLTLDGLIEQSKHPSERGIEEFTDWDIVIGEGWTRKQVTNFIVDTVIMREAGVASDRPITYRHPRSLGTLR